MPLTVITLVSALLVVVVYLLAGRLLLAHTGRNHEATPLQALLVGGALWWVWSVALHGLWGVALGHLWWLYMLGVVVLSFVLGKTHHNEGHSHTFWSRVFLVVLMASPWLVALVRHVPGQLAEMQFDALWPAFIMAAHGWPPAAEITQFHLQQASAGSGFAWLGLPMALVQGQYSDGALPIFNVILLGLTATEILRWRGITLDQDRVFALVPAACVLLTVMMALLGWGWLWSTLPYMLLAALVTAGVRILTEDTLPKGLAALHLGLVLLLLAQVTPFGAPLAALGVVFYGLRLLTRGLSAQAFLGLGLVALLPLMGVGMWVAGMIKAGYPAPGALLLGVLQPAALMAWPLPEAFITLLAVAGAYGIFALGARLVKGLGFHGLGLGASFVLLLLAMVAAHATRPRPQEGVATTHVQAVAKALQNSYLAPGDALAVLDASPYAGGLLRATIGRRHPVTRIGLPDDLRQLHARLQAGAVKYLWVHAPDDRVRGVLDVHMQSTASYLYAVGREGLILKAVFPHPGYTSAQL